MLLPSFVLGVRPTYCLLRIAYKGVWELSREKEPTVYGSFICDPKSVKQADRLETQAGIDAAVLKQKSSLWETLVFALETFQAIESEPH